MAIMRINNSCPLKEETTVHKDRGRRCTATFTFTVSILNFNPNSKDLTINDISYHTSMFNITLHNQLLHKSPNLPFPNLSSSFYPTFYLTSKGHIHICIDPVTE